MRLHASGRRSATAFSRLTIWLARGFALLAFAIAPLGQVNAVMDDTTAFGSLLGAREIRSDNLDLLPKWLDVLARYASEKRHVADLPSPAEAGFAKAGQCEASLSEHCAIGQWKHFLAALEGLDGLRQVEQVNDYFNRLPYVPDSLNYGTRDYWETPFELLTRGGDCEDYAVAKFLALRALGFKSGRLRLMVVQDLILGAPHALLVVEIGGQQLVLDSLNPEVVPAERVRHYRPIYSVDEQNWWLHLS